MADKKTDPVVVIGLGRFGTSLALELPRRGTEVLAIDNRPKVAQSLAGQVTHIATADSTDLETLRQLDVPDFYKAVVAIGGDLGASILTTSLPIELEIDDIWAKAVSRHHGRILRRVRTDGGRRTLRRAFVGRVGRPINPANVPVYRLAC
ncbi:NAD-binding protein [Nonomuraea sp. NPDC048881]|uniref:potassium channel family protein n=1 Tax=Nonomuraea sp. NPDC048881 TaxID=3155030 RepID=UPI0033C358CE